jgi:competence protein ComGC
MKPAITDPRSQVGFTLVGLLVVITVIVVLLALLTPALDRAIYQAELATCGAGMKSGAASFTVYAFDHRRQFPARPGVREWVYSPEIVKLGQTHANSAQRQGRTWDDRGQFEDYLDIDGALNDPLSARVDLEVDDPATTIWTSYYMWFNWDWDEASGLRGQGPAKVGDLLTFLNDKHYGPGNTFQLRSGLLLSDKDYFAAVGFGMLASHPDRDGVMHQNVMDNEPVDRGTQDAFVRSLELLNGMTTLSEWAGATHRGDLDTQHAYQDGSVRRLDNVGMSANVADDPRTTFIPTDGQPFLWPGFKAQVPAN